MVDLTPLNDDGLLILSRLNRLKWLAVSRTKITSEGLRVMENLTNLEHLSVGGTTVGDRGVGYIPASQRLKVLCLLESPASLTPVLRCSNAGRISKIFRWLAPTSRMRGSRTASN